jgi:hypothetical protein
MMKSKTRKKPYKPSCFAADLTRVIDRVIKLEQRDRDVSAAVLTIKALGEHIATLTSVLTNPTYCVKRADGKVLPIQAVGSYAGNVLITVADEPARKEDMLLE